MTAPRPLAEKLADPAIRPRVLDACQDLIRAEVADKGGLSGVAIKAAFKVVQAIKPGIVRELVDAMLDEFAVALEPMHTRAVTGLSERASAGESFEDCLRRNANETADALLSVTDRRAEKARNATLRRTYEKLRASAKTHVVAAVPSLARTLAPFV